MVKSGSIWTMINILESFQWYRLIKLHSRNIKLHCDIRTLKKYIWHVFWQFCVLLSSIQYLGLLLSLKIYQFYQLRYFSFLYNTHQLDSFWSRKIEKIQLYIIIIKCTSIIYYFHFQYPIKELVMQKWVYWQNLFAVFHVPHSFIPPYIQ